MAPDAPARKSANRMPAMTTALHLAPTPKGWVDVVLDDFNRFLQDHASCEKKAAGMALKLASHYPDKPVLLNAMADLAVEEMSHYREVIRLLTARGAAPAPDEKDPYIAAMNRHVRQGPACFLLDRLAIAALVEARGCQRFGLLAEALPEGAERRFFRALYESERRHSELFLDLARQHCDAEALGPRIKTLIDAEADIVAALPLLPRLH